MRPENLRLKVGEIVQAQIEEKIADRYFIASFKGNLIRVKIESLNPIQISEKIWLQVTQANPLAFKKI